MENRKKVLILSSSESSTSISPHVANAKELHKHLGWDLVFDVENDIRDVITYTKYDALVFVHGTGREKSSVLINTMFDKYGSSYKPDLYYIKNDYDLGENNSLWALCRDWELEYTMISNFDRACETRCKKRINEWHTVNLNTLLFNEFDSGWRERKIEPSLFAPTNPYGGKEHGLMYWGQYRKDRLEGFKRFMDKEIFFSTSKKNMNRFKAHFDANFVNRIPIERFREFKYTIYLEDETQHTYYHHLANRFYEALMYDIVMFFDVKAINTLERAKENGYVWNDIFIVNDKAELHSKVELLDNDRNMFELALEFQRKNYNVAIEEKKKTLNQISEIVNT